MERIGLGALVAAVVVAVVGYFVVTVLVVPLVAGPLLELAPGLAAVALAVIVLLPVGLSGVVAARRQRRRGGRRAENTGTAATAGAAAGIVVSGIGAMASIANHAPVAAGPIVVTIVTFAVVAGLAALLVRPAGDERAPAAYVPSRDAGQASPEALGTTAAAVLLVVGALVVMTPAGTWLREEVRAALCQVVTLGSGGCDASSPLASGDDERPMPEHQCVLTDRSDDREVAVSVTWLQVEGGGQVRVEELSDRTYRVSADGEVGAGGQIGVGAGGSWTVDGQTDGVEATLGLSGVLGGTGGVTWVVDASEKDQLVEFLNRPRGWDVVPSLVASSGSVGEFVGALTDAGQGIVDWARGGYRPGAPQEVYLQAGVKGSASGSATGLERMRTGGATTDSGTRTHGGGSAGASAVLGMRRDLETGRSTLYYRATLSGQAAVQFEQEHLLQLDGDADGTVEALIAVTYDPSGEPLAIHAQHLMVGSYGVEVASPLLEDVRDGDAGGRLYDARLSLTDAEASRAGHGLLRAAGIPTPSPGARADGARDAFAVFVDAARERGTLTRQEVTSEGRTLVGVQAGGEIAGVGVGASWRDTTTTIGTTAADYWDGTSWRPWTGCLS